MNDTRPARRPSPSRQSPQRRRRRRRSKNAQFQRFLLIHQIILVLVALAIGYFIGTRAGAAAPDPDPTGAPPVSQTQPPETTAPAAPGDTTAPKILGVNKMSLFVGGTVAYRSGILVTDDTDPAPKLTVDSFQVNLSAPGE